MDERLRRIARMDAKEWQQAAPDLRGYFYEAAEGLRHHRVDAEFQRAAHNIDQRSKAGKASAEAMRQLSGSCSHYRVWRSILEKIFGVRVDLQQISEDCAAHRNTVSTQNAKLKL